MENVAGELTKSDLKKVLAGAGVKESGEMDFTTFKKVMLDLEDVLNDGEDDEEDDDSETVLTSKEGASPVQSAGKGFARSDTKKPVTIAEESTEMSSLTNALFDNLRGSRSTVALEDFRKWDGAP